MIFELFDVDDDFFVFEVDFDDDDFDFFDVDDLILRSILRFAPGIAGVAKGRAETGSSFLTRFALRFDEDDEVVAFIVVVGAESGWFWATGADVFFSVTRFRLRFEPT